MTKAACSFYHLLTDLLGMAPKFNYQPDLLEYNSSYLCYDDQGPLLVPKASRALKRLYIEREESNADPELMTVRETFILQATNYAEATVLQRVPVVRSVLQRSQQLFGSVKVSIQDYQILRKDNNPARQTQMARPGFMNADYLDRYCTKNFKLSVVS